METCPICGLNKLAHEQYCIECEYGFWLAAEAEAERQAELAAERYYEDAFAWGNGEYLIDYYSDGVF